MKKTLLQILMISLLWLGVLCLCIRLGGDGLTLYFEQPPEATGMLIRFDPENIVKLADSRILQEEQEVQLVFAAVQRGETEATVVWEGLGEDSLYENEISMTIRSLPMGILTDSITWNFTGWEYLVICLALYFLSISLILFFASRREQKRVFFSYRSIRFLGLAIFFLALSFFRTEYLLNFLKGRNAGTVWTLLLGIISSAQTFVRWSAYLLAVFAILTALSNIVLMRHEGVRPANMLGILVAVVIVGGAMIGIALSNSRLTFPMRNVLCNVYAGLFVYFECLLTATVIRALKAGKHEPAYDKDYIIILGCKIRPDGTLYPLIRGRVDRAIEFAQAQEAATGKVAVLVPSGGQGSDEPMSEAEAMAGYMHSRGVTDERILMENRSQTTKENLDFSRNLITEKEKVQKTAFSTSSYHVCRGGILAEEMGWNIDGMGSRTKWYFWPNAFLREFIGLLAESWVQQVIAVTVIAVLSGLLTVIM